MKDMVNEEPIIVYRRYKDIDWLYQVLQCQYPACIIPPIPPKSALSHYQSDESKEIQNRKKGIERFLHKVTNHQRICGSQDLKSFLIDTEFEFEERKK